MCEENMPLNYRLIVMRFWKLGDRVERKTTEYGRIAVG